MTIPTLNVAGGVKCLLKTAKHLQDRGHDVHLYWQAYSLKNYLKHKLFPPKITWTEEEHVVTALLKWSDLPEDLDVLFASSWRTAESAAQWSQKTKKSAYYYVQHDEALWDGGQEVEKTYQLPLKKIVISSWLKEVLKNKYHQESELLVTPVEETLFDNEYNRADRSKRILILHHTFDWKAFETGVSIVSELKNEITDLQLVVLGGREENPTLPENTEYHYQPNKANLEEIYASCGIFLCPSWHEGLGMPSMEAMATGALLVTTDTGGSRDFAIHGKTAFVSPPQEPSSLLANLKIAVMQWSSLQEMREEGRQKIRSFNWGHNIDKLESLISESAQ